MPTKPQRKHVRQMTDLNSKNQFSFADSGLHDALRSLVKNNLIHGGEFADGMPGHGIPWRAPLNVTEYFRDRINGRVYCGIGLRDGENLMCAAKHASKLIGFELLPDSVDYRKREIAKRVVYATAADPSFLMPPYRIFQADLFNFTRETVPKADFYYGWMGDPAFLKHMAEVVPRTADILHGVNGHIYDSSLYAPGHAPTASMDVIARLSEKGRQFLKHYYGRKFEVISIPYDEIALNNGQFTYGDAPRRTEWTQYVDGYPFRGVYYVLYSKGEGTIMSSAV